MFEIISAITKPGGQCNEDAILVSREYMVVVDGATGLEKIHLTNAESDAAWMSHRLCELLEEYLPNTHVSLVNILGKAARAIKRELDGFGYTAHPRAYPSASVAIARQRGKLLECLTLGDAPIFLTLSRQVKVIYDNSVALRDKVVIDKMIDIHNQTGCDVSEARQKVSEQLLENRRQMNKPGAYYIFEPTGRGIKHSKTCVFRRADVQFISLMTDGFSAAQSCYRLVNSREELMIQLIHGEADKLLESLEKESYSDPQFNRFPRFKLMDDASVIVARNTVCSERQPVSIRLPKLGVRVSHPKSIVTGRVVANRNSSRLATRAKIRTNTISRKKSLFDRSESYSVTTVSRGMPPKRHRLGDGTVQQKSSQCNKKVFKDPQE